MRILAELPVGDGGAREPQASFSVFLLIRLLVSSAHSANNNRCGSCVRQRIIRAFLIEEQKIVKRLLGTN
jgi:hypothetical protein